jgi:hypothetical protein
MRQTFIACLIGLLLATASQAGTIRDDRSDSLYLNLGANYPSVGQIRGTDATSSFAASAVLISQNWALTAAHVTSGASSLTFNVGGNSYAASALVTNPNWSGSLSNGYDVGLIYFGSAITNVAPATRYTGSSEKGQTATYVGYGTYWHRRDGLAECFLTRPTPETRRTERDRLSAQRPHP